MGIFHLVIPGLGTHYDSIQDLLFFHVTFLVVTKCQRSLCPSGSFKLETEKTRTITLWHSKSNDNYVFFPNGLLIFSEPHSHSGMCYPPLKVAGLEKHHNLMYPR